MKSNLITKNHFIKFIFAIILATILLFYLIQIDYIKQISADSFYPTGDINQCRLASVVSIGYEKASLPTNILYNTGEIRGTTKIDLSSQAFTNLATYSYPSPARYPDQSTKISVPPNTKVSLFSHFWNYSGHAINIRNINLFLSNSDPAKGDLTRIGAIGNMNTIKFNNNSNSRQGKMVSIPMNSTLSERNNYSGRQLYEFTTIQPIQIIERKVSHKILDTGEIKIEYTNTLKNTSEYNLCNLEYIQTLVNGDEYEEIFCINKNAQKTISHTEIINEIDSSKIDIKSGLITDPNRHIETNSEAYANQQDIFNFNARSLYLERNDSTANNWYSIQPGWGNTENSNITVELLPYKIPIESSKLTIDIPRRITTEIIDDSSPVKKIKVKLESPVNIINSKIEFTHHGIIINPKLEKDIINKDIFIEAVLEDPPTEIKQDINIEKQLIIDWEFEGDKISNTDDLIYEFRNKVETVEKNIIHSEDRQLVKAGVEFHKILINLILIISFGFYYLNRQ